MKSLITYYIVGGLKTLSCGRYVSFRKLNGGGVKVFLLFIIIERCQTCRADLS